MDVGFLILSPDRNIAGLKNTLGSIKLRCWDRSCVCVVGEDATAKEIKEMKEFCPTFKGKNTITSLINTGIKKIKNEWICVVFGGSRVPVGMEIKLASACKKDNEVIFPLTENKFNFIEGSFNGVTLNKKFFDKVGDFPTNIMSKHGLNDFEFAKMLWAIEALKEKVVFKGVLGIRVI